MRPLSKRRDWPDAYQREHTMHMLLLLPAELVSVRKIRKHLDQLARGAVEPSYPGMGICFNMSGHLGAQPTVQYDEYYPQAYLDFGTGLFKLLNAPEMELHGYAAEEDLQALLNRKRFTSVDFTSYCCTSFGGFELTDDSSYPIPGGRSAYSNESLDNWVGDQLQCRLALAESCMAVIREYIKGE